MTRNVSFVIQVCAKICTAASAAPGGGCGHNRAPVPLHHAPALRHTADNNAHRVASDACNNTARQATRRPASISLPSRAARTHQFCQPRRHWHGRGRIIRYRIFHPRALAQQPIHTACAQADAPGRGRVSSGESVCVLSDVCCRETHIRYCASARLPHSARMLLSANASVVCVRAREGRVSGAQAREGAS